MVMYATQVLKFVHDNLPQELPQVVQVVHDNLPQELPQVVHDNLPQELPQGVQRQSGWSANHSRDNPSITMDGTPWFFPLLATQNEQRTPVTQHPLPVTSAQRDTLVNSGAPSLTASSEQRAIIFGGKEVVSCKINFEEMNNGLLSILECPVCSDSMVAHIHLCRNGHNVCETCRPKLTSCATCKAEFTGRNLAMEEVAELVGYPCQYASSGCFLKFRHKDKKTHEHNCGFRPFQCMFWECKWKINRYEYHLHLQTDHSTRLLTYTNNVAHVPLINGNTEWVLLTNGKYFLIIFMVVDESICLGDVFYDGTLEEASKYSLLFCIKHPTEPDNSINYTCIPDDIEMRNNRDKLNNRFRITLHVPKRYSASSGTVPVEITLKDNKFKFFKL